MSKLQFLFLEDNPLDAEVLKVKLKEGGIDCELRQVATRNQFIAALISDRFDIILADYAMPGFNGLTALEIILDLFPEVPFIFISGSMGEELAIESLKKGATDYVLKQRLERLVPCIRRALKETQKQQEYQRIARALQKSEAQFRSFAENSNDVIWITDSREYRLIYVSPSYETVWGRSSKEIYADLNNFLSYVYPEDRDRLREAWQHCTQGKFTQEYRIIRPDGKIVWIRDRGFPIYDNEGNLLWLGGIALASRKRTIMNYNVPKSEDPQGSLQKLVEVGFICGQSTPLISRSGKPIGMVSNHWNQHYQPTERQLRFLDLLTRQAADLIERKQQETEREKLLAQEQAARAEAEQANNVKDRFLAIVSHELRTPLSPILGWTTLLQTQKLNSLQTTQALEAIQRNAKLQAKLIEDLLDVSSILRGKLNLNITKVDLVATIHSAMETVRLAAESKSIQIHTNLEADVLLVLGDPNRLQQVLWNLLSNAIKFTPEGGRVDIRLENLGSTAQITVRDTGKGIDSNFLPHVFEYFFQEDGTTTRKYGGLGLGLAIVRQLVELHGGTIQADSPGEGQGATFTLRFPLKNTSSPTSDNHPLDEPALN